VIPCSFSRRGDEIFYCLIDAVVSLHIIAGSFESQYIMIAHIMFGEAIFVIAPHYRVSQMQIFDLGLQFARVVLTDPPTEDHRQLVGSAEVAIGIARPKWRIS